MAEQIVLSDFVTCNTTIIPDLAGGQRDKLTGHIISMPIQCRTDNTDTKTQLKTNISGHIKIVFFNDDAA